jgi:hypothetical protein
MKKPLQTPYVTCLHPSFVPSISIPSMFNWFHSFLVLIDFHSFLVGIEFIPSLFEVSFLFGVSPQNSLPACSQWALFLIGEVLSKRKFWDFKFEKEMILNVFSHQKWGRKKIIKIKKTPCLYTWFSLCSQKYKKMIKDLYFISGLYPDLAKSSKGWLSLFLQLLMDGLHFGYKQKFLKKTLELELLNVGVFFLAKFTIFEQTKWEIFVFLV